MLFDFFLALGFGLLGGLLNAVLPTFSWSVPLIDLAWLSGPLSAVNRYVALDQLYVALGLVVALRVGLVVFSALMMLWSKLPVLGHGVV